MSIRELNPTRRDVLAAGLAGTTALVLPQSSWGAGSLRVGSLKFGSLGWLLETVIAEGLDTSHGFKLDLVDMASTGAAKIALLSGDADVIVSDWPWANVSTSIRRTRIWVPWGAIGTARSTEQEASNREQQLVPRS